MIINTTSALKDIYGGSRNGNLQKAPHYKYLHQGQACSSSSAIDKDIHARKRRVVAHAFSDHALKALEAFMLVNVDVWCKLLAQQSDEKATWAEPVDMARSANYLTFDVLGDLAFGKSFGLLQSPANRWLPEIMLASMARWQVVGRVL